MSAPGVPASGRAWNSRRCDREPLRAVARRCLASLYEIVLLGDVREGECLAFEAAISERDRSQSPRGQARDGVRPEAAGEIRREDG